jgi:hypothetical protein
MPLLSHDGVRDLLNLAYLHAVCRECGRRTAQDYCRTCDEFYWMNHAPGCMMHEAKHDGHRLTIVPFVEDRSK